MAIPQHRSQPDAPLATAELGVANHAAEPVGDEDSLPVPVFIDPPWHVRHARKLIAATSAVVASGAAYFSYEVWQIHANPLDRAIAERVKGAVDAAPEPVTAPPVAIPASPLASPKRAITKPVVASVAPAEASPIAETRSGEGRPAPVTHTQPESAPAATEPAPVRSEQPACSDGVVALGLCPGSGSAGK